MRHPHTPLTRTLEAVRTSLLRLHKQMLDIERRRYEGDFGRIENNSMLLQLVISDPFFAWLHTLSELIVEIDERMDADEQMSDTEVRALLDQIRGVLRHDPDGDVFERNYDRAIQEAPDVVIAHVELTRVLDAEHRSR